MRVYSVEVTADAPGLQRYLRSLMPDEDIQVSASGNSVTLSGTVKDPNTVARAIQIAQGTGAPGHRQPDRAAGRPGAAQGPLRGDQPDRAQGLGGSAPRPQPAEPQQRRQLVGLHDPTAGATNIGFLLDSGNAQIQALIQAAVSKGDLRTLAEPNLLTLPGKEAYFLAGGEFPYPTVQSGNSASISIVFKEFGIKLRFTPNIARNGAIRLKVAPEVSTLDFANGLTISGFQIPSLRTRRAETEVELREGQYLSIAGLLDNESTQEPDEDPDSGRYSDPGRILQVPGRPSAPDRAGGDRDPAAGDGVGQRAADSDGRARADAGARQLELGWQIEGSREVGEPVAAWQFFVSESAVR